MTKVSLRFSHFQVEKKEDGIAGEREENPVMEAVRRKTPLDLKKGDEMWEGKERGEQTEQARKHSRCDGYLKLLMTHFKLTDSLH